MKILYIITLFIFISGCGSHEMEKIPLEKTPTSFKESIKVNNSLLEKKWWKNFNDKNLNVLVDKALKNNVNYKMNFNNQEINSHSIQDRIIEEKKKAEKLELVSKVSSLYFQIGTINANISNISRQLDISSSLFKISNTQYSIGYIDASSQREAKMKENSVRNDLRLLKKEQKIYMNSLADLLGQFPENFKDNINPPTSGKDLQRLIPRTDPKQMLANRPDIQIARLEVNASRDMPGNWFVNLMHFGRSENIEDQYENAVLNYNSTVLNAFQEVDDALLSFKEDKESLFSNKAMANNAAEDYKTASVQYKAGQIDYATFLNFELHKLQTEYELNQQNLLVYEDIIQIYKALGMV